MTDRQTGGGGEGEGREGGKRERESGLTRVSTPNINSTRTELADSSLDYDDNKP